MSLSLPTLGELGQPRARRQGGLPVDVPPSLLAREMGGLSRFTSGFFRGILELGKLPFATGAALIRGEAPSRLPPVQLVTGIAKSAFETGRDVGRLITPGGRSELAEKVRNRSLVEVVGEDAINILGASKLTGVGLRRALGRATPLTRALESPVRTAAAVTRRRVARPALERAARGEQLGLFERAISRPERRALAGRREGISGEIIEGVREVAGASMREANVAIRTSIAQTAAAIADSPAVAPFLHGVNPRARKAVIEKAVGEAHADLAQGPGRLLSRMPPAMQRNPTVLRRLLPEDVTTFTDNTGAPIAELNQAKFNIRKAIVTDPTLSRLVISKLDDVSRAADDLRSIMEQAEDVRVGLGGKPRIGEEIKVGELIFSRKDVNTRIRPALARTDPTVLAKEQGRWVVSETEVANRARALLEGEQLTKESARIIRQVFERPALRNVPARWQPLVHSTRKLAEDLRSELKAAGMSDKQIRQVLHDDLALPQTMTDIIQRALKDGFDPIFVPDLSRAQVNRYLFGHPTLGALIGGVGEVVITSRAKPRARILATQGRVVQDVADAFDAAMTETISALRSNTVAKFADEVGFDIPVQDVQTAAGAVAQEKVVPPGFQAWDPVARVAGTDAGFVRQPHVTKMIPDSVARELNKWNKAFAPTSFKGYDKFLDGWRTMVLTMSPRWYLNNLVGNIVLATTQGVRLRDWAAAWRTLREGGQPFAIARRAPEGFLQSFLPGAVEATGVRGRLGSSTLIRTEFPLRKGTAGSLGASFNKRLQQISQANFIVDEIARTAAFKSLRRKGQTIDEAVRGANRLMVDYMDMTPWQRAYVRRVVPFVSWQKGILKVASRLPIDHPVRVAAFYLTGKTLAGFTDEERRNYPAFMFHSIPLSALGPVGAALSRSVGGDDPTQDRLMTRGANPFADALSLSTPEGIQSSLSPVAEWFLRGIFQRPSETNIWTQKLDVSTGGFLVPEYDWAKEGLLIFRDLPPSRLVRQLIEQDARVQSGRAAPLLSFTGLNIRTREEIARAVERQLKSAEAAAGTQAAAERREAGLTRPGGRRRRSTGLPTLAELGAPRGR